jgi:tetratricopeptide (TPR) repeat protein
MKYEQREELKMLALRLFTKGAEFHASFGPAIGRYKDLAEETNHVPALNDALVEQASLLMNQGRYCEAIQVHEERLIQNPCDIKAQQNWRWAIGEAHSTLSKLAYTAPETAEYGRTYEKLLQLGHVGTSAHLGAIRHYLASGQIDRAVERLIPLAQLAPNLNGVADMIIRLSKVSDNVKLYQLRKQLERSTS